MRVKRNKNPNEQTQYTQIIIKTKDALIYK